MNFSAPAASWPLSVAPPAAQRGRCYQMGKDLFGLSAPGSAVLPSGVDEKSMSFAAVITTIDQDRVGDVVVPAGVRLDNFARSPGVFFGHQQLPLPIGRAMSPDGVLQVQVEPERILSRCYMVQRGRWADTAADIFHLILEGALNGVSIGFNPVGPVKRLEAGGCQFDHWDLLEWSVVGVAANPQCQVIRSYLSRGRITGKRIDPLLVKGLESLAEPVRVWSPGGNVTVANLTRKLASARPIDIRRWAKNLPLEFDVSAEPLAPARLEYEWISRHVGVPIKKISVNETSIPSPRLGSFLAGLNRELGKSELVDVRNITGTRENPPVHQTIQLNSKLSEDYLIDGTAFFRGSQGNFAVSFHPSWSGLQVCIYTAMARRSYGKALLRNAWQWAKENNFLKGEAFSLGGDFLDRTAESWDDVFLEKKNKDALVRAVDRMNQMGSDTPNRGVLLTGPPGTGKTLSGRIVRNTAQATFIWISARDFHYAGSVGGLSLGFELARELSPAVLFIEDVDNWLHGESVDLLKTEMDGISRYSGVLTILTTNFPERIPKALIDRPGRFHDVLYFALPDEAARREMLFDWLGVASDDIVAKTAGYSGAHLYELAQFALSLQESDGIDRSSAIAAALRKIAEQQELITSVQLQGSHYRPRQMSTVRAKSLVSDGNQLRAHPIPTAARGDPLMSKKWGKVRQRRKASKLAEGAGTAGGYTVPPETAEDDDLHKRLRSAILLVAERHKEADPDASYHYSPASVRACHVHGATVPMEVKATVKADLEGIDGLKGVLQGALPEEEGWEKLFPVAEHTLEQNPIPPQERRAPVAQRKQELPAAALPVGDEVDDEPDGDADDDPNLPLGAQCLAALLEHLAEKTPLLEQPDIRAFYEQLLVDARDLALEVYPDLDLGLESQEEAEEEPEETPAELAPEASSPYRSYRPERLKRLSKRAASVIREAADHLSDLCELEHGASWTRTHKAACRMHHRALDGLHRELGGESSEEGPVDEKAIVQQALQEALGPLQETIYQLTGKAAPQAHTPQARTSQAHAG